MHANTVKRLKPYDKSIFDIKFKYKEVYPLLCKEKDSTKLGGQKFDSKRLHKIKYIAYLLTSIDEETPDGRLMDALKDSEELELFNSELVQEVINFKW